MSNPATNKDKWIISIIAGLIFLVISSPFMYKLTNDLAASFGQVTAFGGSPTMFGLVLHTVVFLLVVRLLMR